jgi:hypothetical protein
MQLFPIGRVYAFEPMKTIIPLLALAALCGSSSIASAQQPTGTPPAREEKDKPMDWKKYRDQMENLPEDVRKRFREAKEEAMKDPEIQALREKTESAAKELREAVRKVISEKNPDLADQLATYFNKTSPSEPKGKDKKPRPGANFEDPLKKLPPAERTRLEAAREIAKQAPAVQSAEAAMQSASSPEARHEAAENFRKAMRDAMITADPSLADVLDKIKPAKNDSKPASAEKTGE